METTDTKETTPKQKRGIQNTLISLFGLMALILGTFFYTAFSPKPMTDEQKQAYGFFQYEQGRALKDFDLLNHDGQSVSVAQLKGQWSLVFFGFTYCPDVCPTTMGVLARAMKKLEQQPQVIMVSVDPERDSPEVLSRYVPTFDPKFVGYTGGFDDIVGLATQLNSAFGKVPGKEPGTYTVDHSASISIINPEGEYMGFLKTPHDAIRISEVMKALMSN